MESATSVFEDDLDSLVGGETDEDEELEDLEEDKDEEE